MRRRAFGLLAALAALAGCTAAPYPGGQPYAGAAPPANAGPPKPVGTRIALLLPLTGPGGRLGQAMLRAAELAMAMGPSGGQPVQLDPRDTGGTPEGATLAVQAALNNGDALILGPLTAPETAAAAPEARTAGVPMLAFTSDASRAEPGVWTLGITPVQQVRRLVAAATAENRSRFAAVLGREPLGDAMGRALAEATRQAGLPQPTIRTVAADFSDLDATVETLSGYTPPQPASPPAAPDAGTAAAPPPAPAPAAAPAPLPFDALLVDATGARAQQLGATLAKIGVAPPQVRVLGPGLWAGQATQLGALAGAWYAAPDPASRAGFVQRYVAKYGATPPPLADLAFDAASLGRVLGAQGPLTGAVLTQPDGFGGVDGFFALLPNGQVRRGLAVFQIERTGGRADRLPGADQRQRPRGVGGPDRLSACPLLMVGGTQLTAHELPAAPCRRTNIANR